MRLLRQPQHLPMSLSDQVISLVAAMERVFVKVPLPEIKDKQRELLDKFKARHAEIIEEIEEKKVMDDELRARIVGALEEFGAM